MTEREERSGHGHIACAGAQRQQQGPCGWPVLPSSVRDLQCNACIECLGIGDSPVRAVTHAVQSLFVLDDKRKFKHKWSLSDIMQLEIVSSKNKKNPNEREVFVVFKSSSGLSSFQMFFAVRRRVLSLSLTLGPSSICAVLFCAEADVRRWWPCLFRVSAELLPVLFCSSMPVHRVCHSILLCVPFRRSQDNFDLLHFCEQLCSLNTQIFIKDDSENNDDPDEIRFSVRACLSCLDSATALGLRCCWLEGCLLPGSHWQLLHA